MSCISRRDALAALTAAGVTGLAGCVADTLQTNDGNEADGNAGGSGGSDGQDGPTVVDVTTETVSSGCLDPTAAGSDVTIDGQTVRMTGVIEAPNPCHVVVADAAVEATTLTVSVDVEPEDDVLDCIQCVGSLEYDVSVNLSESGIETVDVRHVEESQRSVVDEGEPSTTEPDDE